MFATPSLVKLRALTAAERRVLVEAALILPLAAVALRLAGFRATRGILDRFARPSRGAAAIQPAGVARMVAAAARLGPVRARCLAAALTLEALLRRRGFPAHLRLGVRKHEGRLEAHAWIEHEGAALMEPSRQHAHFLPFEGLPARR
jgi:hypothetical protein